MSRDKIRGLSSHHRTKGAIMNKGYMMKEKMIHGKGKADAKHESKESRKKKLAEKMAGMGKS